MKRWRLLGVDKILKEAYQKGIILSGISAGGICWFDSGHSDSLSFNNPNDWKYINVKGLGLIKGIHCPHFNSGTTRNGKRKLRKNDFKEFMKNFPEVGIAIDNNCAIEFSENDYRVLSSKKGRFAYKVFWKKGKYHKQQLPETKEFLNLKDLLK